MTGVRRSIFYTAHCFIFLFHKLRSQVKWWNHAVVTYRDRWTAPNIAHHNQFVLGFKRWWTSSLNRIFTFSISTWQHDDRKTFSLWQSLDNTYLLYLDSSLFGFGIHNSKASLNCRISLNQMTEPFKIHLLWVSGYRNFPGNSNADKLARPGTT